jgi:GTP-binding protein LepA
MDYDVIGFRHGDLVKMDILVNGDRVDALSVIVHRDHAEQRGRKLLVRLKGRNRPPPLRNPPASRHRRQDHRPRDDQVRRQERHRQVLRRRRDAQAQAAGEAERRQEAHEARRAVVDIPQEAFMAILESGD